MCAADDDPTCLSTAGIATPSALLLSSLQPEPALMPRVQNRLLQQICGQL
jgi:hypothetical protein